MTGCHDSSGLPSRLSIYHSPLFANRPLNQSQVDFLRDQSNSRLANRSLDNRSLNASGVGLAIAGTFLFALKSIFVKLAYAAGAEPTQLLLLRLVFALPFYVVVFLRCRMAQGRKPLHRTQLVHSLLLGFLGYYLPSYLDLQGLQYITAQLERLTLFIYPAIVAMLAWLFLGEGLNRRILLSIVLCYCGVAVMYGQERSLIGGTNVTWGIVLVSGSALSYSVYVLFAKSTMTRIGSRQFTSLAMIGSTVFVVIHYLVTRDVATLTTTAPVVILYGIVLAVVCTVIPSFMINEAIMRIGATRTAVIGSVGPVLTMLLAIAVLQEPSTPGHFGGMPIAMIGLSLVTRKA